MDAARIPQRMPGEASPGDLPPPDAVPVCALSRSRVARSPTGFLTLAVEKNEEYRWKVADLLLTRGAGTVNPGHLSTRLDPAQDAGK